jgi:hypothetical protein
MMIITKLKGEIKMQTNNSLLKIFFVMIALAVFTAWSIAPAVAQAGSMGGSNKASKSTSTSDSLKGGGTMGNDHDGSMDQKSQTGTQTPMGMNRYLVMIPHTGTGTCQDVMKDFSSVSGSNMGGTSGWSNDNDHNMDTQKGTSSSGNYSGSDKSGATTRGQSGTYGSANMNMGKSGIWQWGCSTDDQTLYLFTSAPSEEAALKEVPSNLRSEAKVIQMSNFSGQVNNPGGGMQNRSSGQKKY